MIYNFLHHVNWVQFSGQFICNVAQSDVRYFIYRKAFVPNILMHFPPSLFVFGKHWEIILIFWHNSLAHLHSHLVFSPTPRPEQAELVKNSSKARRRQKNILVCTSPVETVLDYNFQILNLEKLVFNELKNVPKR